MRSSSGAATAREMRGRRAASLNCILINIYVIDLGYLMKSDDEERKDQASVIYGLQSDCVVATYEELLWIFERLNTANPLSYILSELSLNKFVRL
jgi:hypothetical protein